MSWEDEQILLKELLSCLEEQPEGLLGCGLEGEKQDFKKRLTQSTKLCEKESWQLTREKVLE